MMRKIVLLFLSAFLIYGNVSADESAVVIMADRETYHVGDIVRLKLELKGKGYRLGKVDEEKIAPFEISQTQESYNEETDTSRFIISGSIYKVGDFTIPPFAIIDESGNIIKSERGVVTIKPLLKDEHEKLKEIKPQVQVDEGGPLWPWIVIALIVLAIAFLLYHMKKRKKDLPASQTIAPEIPPHIEALEEIERIEGLNLIRDGRIKELHYRTSDVIRRFKGRINGIDAMEMTTGELIDALRLAGANGVNDLERFLNHCDRVKFAKFTPSQMDIEGLTERAREMINKEMPMTGANRDASTAVDAAAGAPTMAG